MFFGGQGKGEKIRRWRTFSPWLFIIVFFRHHLPPWSAMIPLNLILMLMKNNLIWMQMKNLTGMQMTNSLMKKVVTRRKILLTDSWMDVQRRKILLTDVLMQKFRLMDALTQKFRLKDG
jgi:hypothetical protein